MMARKNRGQVLVITAVIVVLVLFLIKVEMTYTGSYEFSDTSNVNTFGNMRNELKRSGSITIWKDDYSAVYNFSKFLKEEKDIELFYSIVDFEGTNLNITVANFLKEGINNIQINQNLTDESDSITSLDQEGTDYVNFITGSQGSPVEFEVNISYNSSSGIINHTFNATAGPAKYVTVFYDFKMNYDESYIGDKFSISGKKS